MRLINFACDVDKMDEFHRLHPMLQAVFCNAVEYAYSAFGKALLITSMERPGDNGVHGTKPCRGLDVDVCDGGVYKGGILPDNAGCIEDWINLTFRYDPTRPDMNVAIYGDRDPAGKHWNHIHFQVHPRTVAI